MRDGDERFPEGVQEVHQHEDRQVEEVEGPTCMSGGEEDQELHLHGRRKRRAMLGSSLLHHAEKDEDKRPESWIVAADVTAEFSQLKPALFTKEKTPIDDILASMKVELDGGEDKMAAQLAKKANAACRGLLTMLESVRDRVPSGFQDPMKAMPAEKMDGAFAPWSVAVRKHTMRFGFSSWPMLGMGCFPAARRCPVLVCILNVGALIEKGELQLIEQLDDILDSRACREVPWPMAFVSVGEVLWVPYGMLPLVCTFNDDVGTSSVIPWSNTEMMKAAKSDGEAAEGAGFSMDALVKFAKRHSDKLPWKSVHTPLSNFFEGA